jgi:hypothetical protein
MSKGAAYGFIPAEQMEQLVRRQQANLADPPTPRPYQSKGPVGRKTGRYAAAAHQPTAGEWGVEYIKLWMTVLGLD